MGWVIPSLTGQQIDVILASMSITEERLKTIDFTNTYYNTPAVIVTSKSLDIDAIPEGLSGKIIGVQGSTIHQAYGELPVGTRKFNLNFCLFSPQRT